MTTMLRRQTFQTSRSLEYFSQKELTLQTGHEAGRWPEVILKELLDNALDACETHGILPDLHISISDGVIRVQDNGVGMPPELLARVFDLFAQGDRSLARSEGGLGIGLTLVKTLAEMHGGTVSARSVARTSWSEIARKR